mmetsp:Transcript_8442/g.16820  ORF Transcript_8442/g.16820 Transcript_8442/m.16820 type:complete len:511 (+) Transcript_8442:45-1577(+)
MSSQQNQTTIVLELGSSRIKAGFAGESKPRRVFHGTPDSDDGAAGSGWTVDINDGMGALPCVWNNYFRYISPHSESGSGGNLSRNAVAKATSHEWERTLYPLMSHVLTSVLYIPRPTPRHRVIVLLNELHPPKIFTDALLKVLLEYLGLGSVLIVRNSGGCGTLSYLLHCGAFKSISSRKHITPLPSAGETKEVLRPKAYLVVDIGTYEARVSVSVANASSSSFLPSSSSAFLAETYQVVMAGYHSFLCQILENYRESATNDNNPDENENETDQESKHQNKWAMNASLEDAFVIAQTWVSTSMSNPPEHLESLTTIPVTLPSTQIYEGNDAPTTTDIPIQPLLQAFHHIYLDYTNPSSLIYAMLTSIVSSPIDYRRVALQNIVLIGGGSSALRFFGQGLATALSGAGKKACCGDIVQSLSKESEIEEKKEDAVISSIAMHRFQCLKRAVSASSTSSSGGISIHYPDPFAPDLVSWIGGSVMGSLALKNEDWIIAGKNYGSDDGNNPLRGR